MSQETAFRTGEIVEIKGFPFRIVYINTGKKRMTVEPITEKLTVETREIIGEKQ